MMTVFVPDTIVLSSCHDDDPGAYNYIATRGYKNSIWSNVSDSVLSLNRPLR